MIFISGTDTGCGKTTVGRAIAAALRNRGRSVTVFKPIETGCLPNGRRLVAADAAALAQAAGCALPHETVCPYRLKMPASPERSASSEGLTLKVSHIVDSWNKARQNADFGIAEGAGGLLVPITSDTMMIDIPAALDLPVVLVARDALGTVNHTLLAIEALKRREMSLLGVIFSSSEPHAELEALENAEAVVNHGDVRLLGTLPHLPEADDETLAAAAEEHLDLETLLAAAASR